MNYGDWRRWLMILKMTSVVFCIHMEKTDSDETIVVQGCLGSQLNLSCNDTEEIEILTVVLGDATWCWRSSCCIKDDSCTRNPSDEHVLHVNKSCNRQRNCTMAVHMEQITCGYFGRSINSDFERITYRCKNQTGMNTFENDDGQTEDGVTSHADKESTDEPTEDGNSHRPQEDDNSVSHRPQEDDNSVSHRPQEDDNDVSHRPQEDDNSFSNRPQEDDNSVSHRPQEYDDDVSRRPQEYDDNVSRRPQEDDNDISHRPQEDDNDVSHRPQEDDNSVSHRPQEDGNSVSHEPHNIQGCLGSQLSLSCNDPEEIEILTVVLGDATWCWRSSCCITDDDCTRYPSDEHVLHVNKSCNRQRNCTMAVHMELITCGYFGRSKNSDFERITYRCKNQTGMNTFGNDDGQTEDAETNNAEKESTDEPAEDGNGHRPQEDGNNVSHRPQEDDNDASHRPQENGNDVSQRPQENGNDVSQRPQENDDDVSHRPQENDNDVSHRPQEGVKSVRHESHNNSPSADESPNPSIFVIIPVIVCIVIFFIIIVIVIVRRRLKWLPVEHELKQFNANFPGTDSANVNASQAIANQSSTLQTESTIKVESAENAADIYDRPENVVCSVGGKLDSMITDDQGNVYSDVKEKDTKDSNDNIYSVVNNSSEFGQNASDGNIYVNIEAKETPTSEPAKHDTATYEETSEGKRQDPNKQEQGNESADAKPTDAGKVQDEYKKNKPLRSTSASFINASNTADVSNDAVSPSSVYDPVKTDAEDGMQIVVDNELYGSN